MSYFKWNSAWSGFSYPNLLSPFLHMWMSLVKEYSPFTKGQRIHPWVWIIFHEGWNAEKSELKKVLMSSFFVKRDLFSRVSILTLLRGWTHSHSCSIQIFRRLTSFHWWMMVRIKHLSRSLTFPIFIQLFIFAETIN